MQLSPLAIALSILGGLLTAFSPCVLPVLPIVIGRSLQTHRYGPIALVTGMMSGFAIAGSLLGVASLWFTGLANFMRILAIAVLLVLGMLSLFPKLNYMLLSKLPIPKFKQPERVNLLGEFFLGSQLGLSLIHI